MTLWVRMHCLIPRWLAWCFLLPDSQTGSISVLDVTRGHQWLHFSPSTCCFNIPRCSVLRQWNDERWKCMPVMKGLVNSLRFNAAESLSSRPVQRLFPCPGGRTHCQRHVSPATRQPQQIHAGVVWPETWPRRVDSHSEASGWLNQLLQELGDVQGKTEDPVTQEF